MALWTVDFSTFSSMDMHRFSQGWICTRVDMTATFLLSDGWICTRVDMTATFLLSDGWICTSVDMTATCIAFSSMDMLCIFLAFFLDKPEWKWCCSNL
jgi:hypothetical protein